MFLREDAEGVRHWGYRKRWSLAFAVSSLSGAIREGKWNVAVGRKPDPRRYAGARA